MHLKASEISNTIAFFKFNFCAYVAQETANYYKLLFYTFFVRKKNFSKLKAEIWKVFQKNLVDKILEKIGIYSYIHQSNRKWRGKKETHPLQPLLPKPAHAPSAVSMHM